MGGGEEERMEGEEVDRMEGEEDVRMGGGEEERMGGGEEDVEDVEGPGQCHVCQEDFKFLSVMDRQVIMHPTWPKAVHARRRRGAE